MFKKLIEKIQEVNNILTSRSKEALTFEEGYKLGQFYYDYLNTNPLIDKAEELAHENPVLLKSLAEQLKEESGKLIDNLEKIKDVDFEKIADEQVTKFSKAADEAAEKLNPYWKRYCELNNRLDYLPYDSKEYEETEKDWEIAKKEHDSRQIIVRKLYEDRDRETKRSANLYGLNYPILLYLATKINRIASSILSDLENIGKEGPK